MTGADHVPGTSPTGDRDASLWLLVLVLFRISLLLMARYRVNFFAQLVGMYLFFAVIFFGGQAAVEGVGGIEAIGSTLDAVIVGWFLWTTAQISYSSLSTMIEQESRWGTLEQLYMTPHGFETVMFAKVWVNVFLGLLTGALMLALMLVTTGRTLSLDVVSIVPIAVCSLSSVVGVGFVFAGLTLVYKKLSGLTRLMQFAIVGLIAAPASGYDLLALLPLVQGSEMLQRTMRDGVRLWEFSVLDLGLLVGTATIYLLLGLVAFRYCSYVARKRGVMGHY